MRLSTALKTGLLALSIAATLPRTAMAGETAAMCKTGTPAQNVAVAMDFYKAYQTGDVALLRKALAPDFLSVPTAPGTKPGIEGAITVLERTRSSFSDIKMTQEDIIASGNKVVVRSTIRANHSGVLMGVPATGKPITFTAIDIHDVCDGKIISSHHEEGWLAVLFQIGVLPPKP